MENPAKRNNSEEEIKDISLLVQEHQSILKSFIRKRVSNDEDAEDILQDVFYQLIKTIESNLSPIEQVTSWLYRVARNTIINSHKKKRETPMALTSRDDEGEVLQEFSEILFNENNSTPETEYLRSMVWKELEYALSELPDEQREVFELTEIEGVPTKDVALSLNIPLNTILSRKHYAVKYLRQRLYVLYQEIMFY